jgi:glucose-6-phosphate 1-dehydrogenase
MNNCAIVIFGATGDLTKRKLIPALYRLMLAGKLKDFIVLGAAFDAATPADIMAAARAHISQINESVWQQLEKRFFYQQLNFTSSQDYAKLASTLAELEQQHSLSGNRIMYLACAASFFCEITQQCAQAGLVKRLLASQAPWQRVVYEKPFGHDLQSARAINEGIARVLDEQQIYRIDHYLTKELVSNISLMRFTNAFFEPLWNNNYIEEVQIILSEQVGVDGRGAYYDAYGALRDVVQNHVLELLALVGMEPPAKLSGDFVRANRAKVLEKVHVQDGFLGQYNGYTQHAGVKEDSSTETFAVLTLAIDNARWQGVPFYIKTGKKLNKKETVIHIKFKQVECLLLRGCPTESNNWLTLKIVPDATFSLTVNAKKPGRADELLPVAMEFCHSCIFGEREPEEAYEILLEEVMRGEQSIAVRFDEIEYAWRVIDTVYARALPLYQYEPGTEGPAELAQFEKQHGFKFKS